VPERVPQALLNPHVVAISQLRLRLLRYHPPIRLSTASIQNSWLRNFRRLYISTNRNE
jgi:hypothetical protein